MSKKLTLTKIRSLKRAIDKSIILWTNICNNPGFSKEELYPGIESIWESGCPLCEWNRIRPCTIDTPLCSECPLSSRTLCNFGNPESAYFKWYTQGYKNIYARKILVALIGYKVIMEGINE